MIQVLYHARVIRSDSQAGFCSVDTLPVCNTESLLCRVLVLPGIMGVLPRSQRPPLGGRTLGGKIKQNPQTHRPQQNVACLTKGQVATTTVVMKIVTSFVCYIVIIISATTFQWSERKLQSSHLSKCQSGMDSKGHSCRLSGVCSAQLLRSRETRRSCHLVQRPEPQWWKTDPRSKKSRV